MSQKESNKAIWCIRDALNEKALKRGFLQSQLIYGHPDQSGYSVSAKDTQIEWTGDNKMLAKRIVPLASLRRRSQNLDDRIYPVYQEPEYEAELAWDENEVKREILLELIPYMSLYSKEYKIVWNKQIHPAEMVASIVCFLIF